LLHPCQTASELQTQLTIGSSAEHAVLENKRADKMLKVYLGRCTGSRKPGSTHCSIVEALAVSNDIRHQHQLSLSKALYVNVDGQRLEKKIEQAQ